MSREVIIRRGIAYGEEVDPSTEDTQTKQDRGLLFVAYQSHISRGFHLMQRCTNHTPRRRNPANTSNSLGEQQELHPGQDSSTWRKLHWTASHVSRLMMNRLTL
jgi:deferrochelatase/peroxidase EfeB